MLASAPPAQRSLTLSSRRFRAMATRVEMHFVHSRDRVLDQVFDSVADEIERVENALSAHRPGASLHTLNVTLAHAAGARVTDDVLFDALDVADRLGRASGGLFCPTIGWRTLTGGGAQGATRIDRQRGEIECNRPGVRFDLGAIGKGIALDRIRPVLTACGVEAGLVSLGESSVLALGRHPHGEYWPLSVPDPFHQDSDLIAVGLRDLCWSVSSNLEARDDGVALHPHILHPLSGKAITTPRTILTLHASGARAEALSTAMMAAAPDERTDLAARFADTPIAVFDHDISGAAERRLFNGMDAWLI